MDCPTNEYLGGLFDGEGSFGLTWSMSKGFTPIPTVTLSQKSSLQSDFLFVAVKNKFGGSLKLNMRTEGSSIDRIHFRQRDELERLLTTILPFLIIKKVQAQIVLDILYLLKEVKQGIPIKDEIMLRIFKMGKVLDDFNCPKRPKTWTYERLLVKLALRQKDEYGRMNRANQKFWLDAEINYLRKNYDEPWPVLQKNLHRSQKSIRMKGMRLGLRRCVSQSPT